MMISRFFGLFLIGATVLPLPAFAKEPIPACPSIQGNYLTRIRVRSMPACQMEFAIAENGTYAYRSINGQISRGQISAQDLALLKRRIARANFEQMRSKPFTGLCPVAYDGAEFIYTFQTPKGSEVLESCKVSLDGKNPLLQQLTRLRLKILATHTYDLL